MKVGILTYHHTTNYGATLQAYALWKVIKSQGYDVELVDYRPYKAIRYYTRELIPVNRSLRFNRRALANLLKAWKMRRFLLSKLQLSSKKSYSRAGLKQFHQQYNVLICGSDQIWCISALRGFDPSYFLDFASNQTTRKISYAASFGDTETLGGNREKICKLIAHFAAISVRDSHSSQLVHQECGRQAVRLLDPTFLIEYDKMALAPKVKKEYLLIYRQGRLTLEEESFVRLVAKTKSLAIVSIGNYSKVAHKNLISVSPGEWIGFFKEASYVITNTYHGTIFSIIFRKLFTTFVTINKSNKVMDLLNHLRLENRAFIRGAQLEPVHDELFYINYASAHKVLEAEILRSKTYLLEMLDRK